MRFLRTTFLVWAVCISLIGAMEKDVLANGVADLVSSGREIAEENCKRCHAIDRNGTSTHESAPTFQNIASRYSVWSLSEALAEGIVTGHADMPEFKFEPNEIGALLSFMETLVEVPGNATDN